MTISREDAIALAREADLNDFGVAWQMDKLERLCNLAVEHSRKVMEPAMYLHKTDGYAVTVWEWSGYLASQGQYTPLFTHPSPSDEALLRQALGVINGAYSDQYDEAHEASVAEAIRTRLEGVAVNNESVCNLLAAHDIGKAT